MPRGVIFIFVFFICVQVDFHCDVVLDGEPASDEDEDMMRVFLHILKWHFSKTAY